MKAFLVLALVTLAAAEPPSGYGYPAPPSGGGIFGNFNTGGSIGNFNNGGAGGTVGNQQQSGGQVHRHVYVHVAPDDPEDQQARVVRIPGKGDKHVNIIFVKTPSSSSSAQTEVILPEQEQQKNIVYVLVRKFDPTTDLKIRAPRPQGPSKPEVYFIRYRNQDANGGQNGGNNGGASSGGNQGGASGGGNNGGAYGPPPPPQGQYGAPLF